jgi:hypothetical protein
MKPRSMVVLTPLLLCADDPDRIIELVKSMRQSTFDGRTSNAHVGGAYDWPGTQVPGCHPGAIRFPVEEDWPSLRGQGTGAPCTISVRWRLRAGNLREFPGGI